VRPNPSLESRPREAGRPGPAAGSQAIVGCRPRASYLTGRLSSNVRPHTQRPVVLGRCLESQFVKGCWASGSSDPTGRARAQPPLGSLYLEPKPGPPEGSASPVLPGAAQVLKTKRRERRRDTKPRGPVVGSAEREAPRRQQGPRASSSSPPPGSRVHASAWVAAAAGLSHPPGARKPGRPSAYSGKRGRGADTGRMVGATKVRLAFQPEAWHPLGLPGWRKEGCQ
jgi:hypothetical protein